MKKLRWILVLLLLASSSTQSVHAQSDSLYRPNGAVWGMLFSDYYYVLSADTSLGKGVAGPLGKGYYEPNANISTSANTRYYQAFDIRRLYLGYTYHFAKDIDGGILFSHENGAPGNGDVVLDKNRGLYLKTAFIQFHTKDHLDSLTFGEQATPAFTLEESLWNYRSVEQTILQFRGLAQSVDLGVQVAGSFDKSRTFGYAALVSNGSGAQDETNRYKKFTGELNASLFEHHLILEVMGDYQEVASGLTVNDAAILPAGTLNTFDTVKTSAADVNQSTTTLKLFGAYTSAQITAGIVYASQTLIAQSLSTAGADAVVSAISIFARGTIVPNALNAFARYDWYDPNTKVHDNSSGRQENFLVAGLDWIPYADASNVHIEPNIWIDSFKDKSSANTDYEPITVARLTLYYKF
jgi:hypothetical protein